MLNYTNEIDASWRKYTMKKLTSLICCFLVIGVIPQIVNAGDPTNPEITDPTNDVLLFGQFSLPIANRMLKHIDILSAWFSEKSEEPNFLYVTLQLQDIKKIRLMGMYIVDWYYKGIEYAVTTIFEHGKENWTGIQIQGTDFIPLEDSYEIDLEKNTITWAIPKEVIGDVTVGDTLSSPLTATGLRFCSNILANLIKERFGWNCIGMDISEEGNDYIILY
jgi:hypothetical protein